MELASRLKTDARAGLTVRLARDRSEVAAGYDLAARVFGPNYFEARDAKQVLVEHIEPLNGPGETVIACHEGAVIGFIRLVSRQMTCGSDVFGVTGITSVSVSPEHRGRHVGGALMRVAMAEGRRRGDDLSVLFARRAVDGWYPQFGFTGIGQHVEYRLATTLTATAAHQPGLVEGVQPRSLGRYAAAYRKTAGQLPGCFVRPTAWWARLERRLAARKSATFLTFIGTRRTVVGYALTEGEHVWELCVTGDARMEAALAAVLAHQHQRGHSQCALHVHPRHPATRHLFARNHTLSIRRAWDGGHMAAPLHRAAARRLAQVGLGAPRPGGQGDAADWPVWSPLDEF